MEGLDHASLKARQRAERDTHPESIALRTHRALSWLERSEQCDDDDGRFIFLWIAFNAAYANDLDEAGRFTESEVFRNFVERLVDLDSDGALYNLLWQEFSDSVRVLLANQFVFAPFWAFQGGRISQADWERDFERSNAAANRALARRDTAMLLQIVFGRLYVLRNQLVHGAATWMSSVNRDQVRDGANILGKLVPLAIRILLDNPQAIWGDARYPVVSP